MPMYCFDLNSPINLRIDEIQSDEFVYLVLPQKYEPGLESSIDEMLGALSRQSHRLFLSASTFNLESILYWAKNFSLKWVGFEINDHQGIEEFKRAAPLFGHTTLIPEIQPGKDLDTTISIIHSFLNQLDLPFVFFKLSGSPDKPGIDFFKKLFAALKISPEKKIYFSFNNPDLEEWNLKTHNTYSGMTTVHLDLSNKCTHSCVFCGIWGPDFIEQMKQKSGGQLSEEYQSFIKGQMPFSKSQEILEALPETVQKVQFGGAGDPLTHPQWLTILKNWRKKGFIIEVLTNFEYPSHEEIQELHLLARGRRNFSFLINLSAATAETYKAIRSRQSTAVFEKVLSNIKFAHQLRKRDGFGLSLTIVNIINALNYKEAVKMVELAHELGVGLWLKPVELHSELHRKFEIPESDKEEYKKILRAAATRARELGVELSLEELLMDHLEEKDVYQSIPCTVGFTYSRIEFDGKVKPCCITPDSMGSSFENTLGSIWHNQLYQSWREKFLGIHQSRFHLSDKSYSYCKMCPHIPMNQHAAQLLNKVRT